MKVGGHRCSPAQSPQGQKQLSKCKLCQVMSGAAACPEYGTGEVSCCSATCTSAFHSHKIPRRGAEAGWEMRSGQPLRPAPLCTNHGGGRKARQAHQQGHAACAVRPQPHAVPKVPQVCPHVLDAAVDVAPLLHAHARQLHHGRLLQAGQARSGAGQDHRAAPATVSRVPAGADRGIPGNFAWTKSQSHVPVHVAACWRGTRPEACA